MPTLQFKGKNILWNHHLSVPYHTLEEVEDLHFQQGKGSGNLIIEGDNLIALKALLPEYSGKVKCIYIDPPYNTGNEGWVYNDKVNSPLINNWLGKTVGTDDLTRHDKWLCMMTPRLKMLRDLLSDDGAIFISIDDNEVANLKLLMDEVFGRNNYIGDFIRKTKSVTNDKSVGFNMQHENTLIYAKLKENIELVGEEKDLTKYKNPDNDPNGEWVSSDPSARTGETIYEIINPITGQIDLPPKGRCWAFSKTNLQKLISSNRIIFKTEVKENERGFIYKRYKKDLKNNFNLINSLDAIDNKFMNQVATKEINSFDEITFQYSKPNNFIKKILSSITQKNSIILDSFAGSGTTMHAVNELNKEDGGNRKCILVQMKEDNEAEPNKNICQNITRERNKLAIEKYGYESGFTYLKVGIAIDPEIMLEGQLPTYHQFAKYIYYLGTGKHLAEAQNINAETHFVGTHGAKAFYLIYEQDFEALTKMALNLSIAEDIVKHSPNKRRVIYAPACFLDSDYMEEKQIEFVSIPYNLFERKEN